MATKPGDGEKTSVWQKIFAGFTALTALVVMVGAAVAGWEDGARDEDEDEELDEDLDDEEDEDEDEDA